MDNQLSQKHVYVRTHRLCIGACFVCFALFGTLACSDSAHKTSDLPTDPGLASTTSPPVSPTTSPISSATNGFGVPTGFHPVYILKKDERTNLGKGDIRPKVRIVVPPDLSDAQLENNLRAAAEHAYKASENTHAITVFAYKTGTDWRSAFTAGRLDWAPYGDWNRADEDVPFDQHKAHFDLAEAYRPSPQKAKTAGVRSLDAMEATINAKMRKEEAAVNRRISLSRRQKIYYAAMKALFDDMQTPSGNETKGILAGVCSQYHISYDTEETIRQEGEDEGWPKPQ